MGQGRTLLFGLLAGLVAGCTWGKPVQSVSGKDYALFQGPAGTDVVCLVVALIERPLDDPYLTTGVWRLADEQAVSAERKLLLDENGFRVGQIGGIKPAALQSLLTSTQSCANPRRILLHANKDTVLTIGPVSAALHYQISLDDQLNSISLAQAVPGLQVVPHPANDGQIQLHFTPRIQHGETALSAKAAEDGFVFQAERPVETYAALAWDVTLSPDQYLIIGARPDRPQSLGHQCFRRRDEQAPVQRLLVIRACWANAGGRGDSALARLDAGKTGSNSCLALQASGTKASGTTE